MDSDAIAEAIIHITLNPDKAIQMGMASRQRVYKKFMVEKQIIEIQNLYDDILADHQRRRKKTLKIFQ
jgi:glycosyltransferase involved in cell wall biosynthesis